MINEYEHLLEKSKVRYPEILKQMRHFSKMNKKNFDHIVHDYHNEIFSQIDCTKCGHCCRSYGPVFRNTDVKHICKELGTSEKEFTAKYLQPDSEGVGFELQKLPCPLQNEDNSCSVYDVKPLSCSSFPHTLGRSIQRKLAGLAHDSLHCPAAYLICEKIIAEY